MCPACESLQGVNVGLPASGFAVEAGGEVFRQPDYQIIRCKECALHYKHPHCDSKTLSDYYERLDFESFETQQLFPTDLQVIKILNQLPRDSIVLDFGCGVGRILQSSLCRLECHGVEINLRAADIAAKRGVIIHSGDDLLKNHHLAFDAIILTDVFEHLEKPTHLLALLADKLKPGGRLIMVTGNADAIPNDDLSAEFWYFRVFGHLQMASGAHLEWLSKHLSLALESVFHTSHYELPWHVRLKQGLQTIAYSSFRLRPQSFASLIIACIPWLRRARKWPSAPSCTSGRDHFVAVFTNRKQQG
jgi:SAM-dependent methyltransferase